MKKVLVLISLFLITMSAAVTVDKDAAAVDFVRTLINKANGENGYTNALRYFQFTATTEKNNPYSYVLSKWGKTAVEESGLEAADKGKNIPVLSNRSGVRIDKLWKANKEELYRLFPSRVYNELLKNEVDSLIEFRNSPDYHGLMKKMKSKSRKPGIKTLDYAGAVTQWTGYKQLSFWFRREYEKNDKVVLEILKELKAHYGE